MFIDSHCHFQDARFQDMRAAFLADLPLKGWLEAVVNGTSEADWTGVKALKEEQLWVRASYGLHPWKVMERGEGWLDVLRDFLLVDGTAAVGEIGLDRWIRPLDEAAQSACFRQQWELAVELQRAMTVHCLRAWDWLEKELKTLPPAPRGFLLHSYSGPADAIAYWVQQGAYFSVSPAFAHPKKAPALAAFGQMPLERLLVETDAPDMAPPESLNVGGVAGGLELNHPENLLLCYEMLAQLHGLTPLEVATQVQENHERLFGELLAAQETCG
jgi:TatD DNase family protein